MQGFTQAAIDTAKTALPVTGGKLVFPPGTYSGRLALDGYSNLTIEGYGALLSCPDDTQKVVSIANGSFIRVSGLRVRHTTSPSRNGGGNGFNLVSLTDFVIYGCHVTTVASAGILMRGCERGTVMGNTVRDNWADGIHVTGVAGVAISKDISIEGNHLYNTGDDSIAVVSYSTAPGPHEGVTITGNTIRGTHARGISVLGGKRITIQGNTVQETRASGILVCWDSAYASYAVQDVVVEGNTVYKANTYAVPDTTKYGIEIASSSAVSTVENVVVANNIVREAANRGIFINGYVFQAVVSANTVVDAGFMGISAVGAKNVQIAGNTIIRAARQGVHVESDVTGSIMVAYNTVEDANASNTAAVDAFQLRAAGMDCFMNRVIDNNGFIERDFEFSASGIDAYCWLNHTSGVSTESNVSPTASRFSRTLAMTQGSAAPTTGTWKVGDIVFNTSVAAAGTVAWVCTTAGTPGTWTAWTFGGGSSVTVLDSAEIDFTLTGQQITAILKADSIVASKLDPAIRTSLTKADNALPIAGGTVTGALTVSGATALNAGATVAGGNLNAPSVVFSGGQVLVAADGSINAYNDGAEAFVGMHGGGQLMGGQRLRANPQTGTAYTLVAADRWGLITRANAGASTQTWPQDSAATLPIGSVIRTLNRGAGVVTHQAGAGATVEGQLTQSVGTTCVGVKVAANTWHISGAAPAGGGGAVTSVNTQTGAVVLNADHIDDAATTHKFTTAADASKLAGIAAGAQVNNISNANATDLTDAGDSALHYHATDRDRANHNGAQAISTVTGLQTALDAKQPIDTDLTALAAAGNSGVLAATTAAFTTADETKLDGIATGAQVNNISDVNATDLTDAGASTLHYHTADRDRANHTGEQAVSTVTGLQTALDGKQASGAAAGGVLSGTYPNPGFAQDMATQTELTDVSNAMSFALSFKLDTSVLAASGKGFVNHGSVASTARPSGYASVEWFGTVLPTNWIAGDTWNDPS